MEWDSHGAFSYTYKKATKLSILSNVSTANPGDSDFKPKQNKGHKHSLLCSHLFWCPHPAAFSPVPSTDPAPPPVLDTFLDFSFWFVVSSLSLLLSTTNLCKFNHLQAIALTVFPLIFSHVLTWFCPYWLSGTSGLLLVAFPPLFIYLFVQTSPRDSIFNYSLIRGLMGICNARKTTVFLHSLSWHCPVLNSCSLNTVD